MYYSTQVTGPGSSASTMAAPVAKKTTDAKAADAKAAATTSVATTSAATPASSSPAYTISQSMESLLDAMSGKAPAKAQDNSSGTATDSSGGGSSSSTSSTKRTSDSQRAIQAAADQGKQVASLLNKAVGTFKSDLSSMLSGLGMSDNKVKDAMGSFDDAMKSKMANMDFSNMAVDMQTARSQWSIESRGIELKIKDGDREVSISFAKSTLDFRKDEQSASAMFGANGDMTKGMFSQTTTTATAKATGIIVRGAENFSSDEMKNILGKLTDMASKGGGMKGLATLSPSTDSKGVMHLNVDLSVPVDGLSSGSSTAAAASTGAASTASSSTPAASSVNISA